MKTIFIDLGLPSGTLWAVTNKPGKRQFNKAAKTVDVKDFDKMRPSQEATEELLDQCDRKWDDNRKGFVLTGPNGNSAFVPKEIPAEGWEDRDKGAHSVPRLLAACITPGADTSTTSTTEN